MKDWLFSKKSIEVFKKRAAMVRKATADNS